MGWTRSATFPFRASLHCQQNVIGTLYKTRSSLAAGGAQWVSWLLMFLLYRRWRRSLLFLIIQFIQIENCSWFWTTFSVCLGSMSRLTIWSPLNALKEQKQHFNLLLIVIDNTIQYAPLGRCSLTALRACLSIGLHCICTSHTLQGRTGISLWTTILRPLCQNGKNTTDTLQ